MINFGLFWLQNPYKSPKTLINSQKPFINTIFYNIIAFIRLQKAKISEIIALRAEIYQKFIENMLNGIIGEQ